MAINKKALYALLVIVLLTVVFIQKMTIETQKNVLQVAIELSKTQQETINLQGQEIGLLKEKLKETSPSETPSRIPL